MKTVLVYVLTSPDPPYPQLMDTSLATWDTVEAPGVSTLFYSNRQSKQHPKLIQFQCPGSLYDMGRKDLLAYEWALKNRDWDYMARVSASCYVKKQTLARYVQDLPATNLFRGVGAHKPEGTPYIWGGTHYVISRDVVQAMVDHKAKWNHAEMEDVAMSVLVSSLGIPLDKLGRGCSINRKGDGWITFAYADGGIDSFVFKDFSEFVARTPKQHFIRVKQDGERQTDSWVMQQLFKNRAF